MKKTIFFLAVLVSIGIQQIWAQPPYRVSEGKIDNLSKIVTPSYLIQNIRQRRLTINVTVITPDTVRQSAIYGFVRSDYPMVRLINISPISIVPEIIYRRGWVTCTLCISGAYLLPR